MDDLESAEWRHRLRAAQYRHLAAFETMLAAAVRAARQFRIMSDLAVAAEAREIATHPDLSELNVKLDGFYS